MLITTLYRQEETGLTNTKIKDIKASPVESTPYTSSESEFDANMDPEVQARTYLNSLVNHLTNWIL